MKPSRFGQRIVVILGLGVALPALVLAALGIFLTLRISQAVESQSLRYDHYMAQQVVEGFEQELLAHLREAVASAEIEARNGSSTQAILTALGQGAREKAQFIPLSDLSDYLLLVVESQPVVYGQEARGPHRARFAGMMLRNGQGEIVGAGGWWIDPHDFLEQRLQGVMEERLASNTRIYGGIESTRNLSVSVIDADASLLAKVREPASSEFGTALMEGPFEGFAVRVSPTSNAPVSWARRFVLIEVAFISLMGLVILGATTFGLRYTVRQLELARIKSSFVSNVSHELKTPISLIRLAVETLEMHRFSWAGESEKFVRLIGRGTQRLNQLVDNI